MVVEKLIKKMKNQPNGVSFAEISKVLEARGFYLDRQKGSHCQFINAKGDVLTVPKHSPVKRVYVAMALARIGE